MKYIVFLLIASLALVGCSTSVEKVEDTAMEEPEPTVEPTTVEEVVEPSEDEVDEEVEEEEEAIDETDVISEEETDIGDLI